MFTMISIEEYVLVEECSCKVRSFIESIELLIVKPLIDALLWVVVLGERAIRLVVWFLFFRVKLIVILVEG